MVSLKQVCKLYTDKGDDTVALENINLELPNRGMVFCVGQSGSGKSTLLNCLAGFDTVTEGDICIDGKSLSDMSSAESTEYRKRMVSFVFQDYNLFTDLTVGQNLEFAMKIKTGSIDKVLIQQVLDKVDLKGFSKRNVKKLSGGQKQRVAIARAIITDSKIVLADEPTGNLDRSTSVKIMELLKDLSKSRLVLVVSHDEESAYKYGDRTIKLHKGQIVGDELVDSKVDLEQINSQSNTVDNKQIQTLQSNSKDKKSIGMGFFYAFKMGLGVIKKHKVRFIVSIILPMIFLSILGSLTVMLNYDMQKRNLKEMYAAGQKRTIIRNMVDGGAYGIDIMTQVPFSDRQLDDYSTLGKNFLLPSINIYEDSHNALQKLSYTAHYDSSNTDIQNKGVFETYFSNTNGVVLIDTDYTIDDLGVSIVEGQNSTLQNGGIAISEFAYNTFRRFGYSTKDENGDDIVYSASQISAMTLKEFLDINPTVSFLVSIDNSRKMTFVDIPIVGVFDTGYNFEQQKKNFNVAIAQDITTLSVMHRDLFQDIFVNANSKTVYFNDMLINLTKSIRRDMRYFRDSYQLKKYSNGVLGDYVMVRPYAQSIFFGDLEEIYHFLYGLKIGLIVTASVFAVVAMILMANFVVTAINGNIKQIGILRSLGGSSKDIATIYALESFVSMLIIFVLGVIGTVLAVTQVWNRWLIGDSNSSFGGTISHLLTVGGIDVLILLGFVIVITAISVFLPIYLLCRKKPIDSIRLGAN